MSVYFSEAKFKTISLMGSLVVQSALFRLVKNLSQCGQSNMSSLVFLLVTSLKPAAVHHFIFYRTFVAMQQMAGVSHQLNPCGVDGEVVV